MAGTEGIAVYRHKISLAMLTGAIMRVRPIVVFLMLALTSGCGDGTLPLSQYDKVDVNVYFYFPNGSEVFLGETRGASSCGAMSHNFAQSKNLERSDGWSYICCTIEKGWTCYRKIR